MTPTISLQGAYATIWDQCNVMAGPYRPISFELLETFGLEAHHKTEEQREMFRKGMRIDFLKSALLRKK